MAAAPPLRKLAGLAALTLTALAVAGCALPGSAKGVQDIEVAHASSGTITSSPGGLGTTAAAINVTVSVDVRDDITSVMVHAGDKVTKGQPLFGLNPVPLQVSGAALQNRLTALQADIVNQQGQLAIAIQKGAPTVAGIRARIQADEAEIALTKQLIDIANGHSATITSPLDGQVAAVNITPGLRVSPGAPLVEIVDVSQLEVTANLTISEQVNIAPGATGAITFPSLPDLTLPAVVRAVPPNASNNGKTFQVVVDAANTPDQRVRPGLQAYVRVNVAHTAVVIVNKLAVLNLSQDPSVFVIDGQTAHRHRIHLGIGDEQHYEVLGGLNSGDQVVIVGAQALDDGTPVRITKDEGV